MTASSTLKPGVLLAASASLDDPAFARSLIVLARQDANGWIGFIINRLFERQFQDLVAYRHSPVFPLYAGGPVDTENLFMLHRCPSKIPGGAPVGEQLYLGGDFNAAVRGINNRSIPETDIRLFVGYCGWDPGQLEAEIGEGSFIPLMMNPLCMFDAVPPTWESLVVGDRDQ